MSVHISSHLRSNQLQSTSQSGFRKAHSCKTEILKIYDDIHKELDAKNVSSLAFLDFSSTFDTMNHNILKKKLLKHLDLPHHLVILWKASGMEEQPIFLAKMRFQI